MVTDRLTSELEPLASPKPDLKKGDGLVRRRQPLGRSRCWSSQHEEEENIPGFSPRADVRALGW